MRKRAVVAKISGKVEARYEYCSCYGVLIRSPKKNGKKVLTSNKRTYCASPLIVANVVKSGMK